MSKSTPLDSIRFLSVSSDKPGSSIFVTTRARTHHTPPWNRSGMRLENVEPDQDLVGARMMRLPATVDANNTSQGMHDRRSRGGGIRNARPAMSGAAPGKPIPFETRPMTSQDCIGRPSSGGATRSRRPSASTPVGWNRRRVLMAAPSRIGNAATSEACTGLVCPKRRRTKHIPRVYRALITSALDA